MSREKITKIERADQWESMTSPIRFEIWEFLRGIGPCSIKELAQHMDRAADGLYHHIRKLIAADLVVEVDSRKVGKQTESIFDVTGEDLTFDFNLQSPEHVERMTRLISSAMRCADRATKEAIASREITLKGRRRNFWARWDATWLTNQDLEEVNGHLSAIQEILERARTKRKGRLFAMMTCLTPIFRNRHADS